MAGGRPVEYKPEYCRLLIEFMSDPHGLSFRAACAKMGISKSIAYVWLKEYPEFLDARDLAFEMNLLFFEEVGNQAMMGGIPNFQHRIWQDNMRNRHHWNKEDKEKQQVDISIVVDQDDRKL